ncbi:uncharacterized protein LOC126378365 isoform X1 [Pectinophora gossypiella]|uniref:uncharacterized protein LOC126378365 isoform X1 n=2 Tax=Pectinophora gossypiella TaxID=13191 RepID=UPI00214E4448|nr:uncharacterized protein LOC126378365 isoform X1 [Pectinophora gossypiella]
MSLTCHVVKNITSDMPQFLVQKHKYHFPSYVRLADNDFDTCDKISILLGCDIFFQVLLRDQIPVVPGKLFLQNTRFGFVVAGRVPAYAPTSSCLASNFCTTQSNLSGTSNEFIQPHCHLDKIVSQFWQTEKVPEVYTEGETEQQLTEQIFKESVVLHDDKFEVALPLKQDINKLHLGNSLSCALKRFHNLELRFKKDDTLFKNYKAFIDEYVDLGHAKYIDVSEYDLEEQAVFFLPHHPVFNENSLTTQLRVVFDGSMQSLSKISLNDVLLNGPVVQNDLFSILILFRLYKYILNCDMTKNVQMYKRDTITPPIANILWRPASDSAIQCLQLQTVTYGLKSSSYLATRCLVELANRYRDQFCLASDALLHKTYVDDICLSDNDLGQLIKTRDELIQLLKKGGFSLHKWCANNNSLLQDLPLFNDCSKIDKMKRIVAYIFTFVKNCKSKKEDRICGNLMPKELDFALKIILKNEHRKFFSQEINVLKSKQPLLKSNLKALNPFLDNMDILRVGGRLHYADIPYSKKHPIILPKGSKIVHYLIKKEHGILLHAGPKLVLTNLSQIYHIVNGIREVKHVLHKCLICFKLKAKNAEQLMGSLPSDRVNPCRVFEKVGIDYGGPFNVKMLRVRKPVIQKAYILIFVCFITKAIHVELCTDLTTDCFPNALKRFISRRNKPSIIYCDNASTFKWHKQYIIQLQSRPKWRNVCYNIKVGSLVIVKEDNVAPLLWPMARVVDVFPGADGKVRALSIKTCKGSIVKTSIHKVCILPIDNE